MSRYTEGGLMQVDVPAGWETWYEANVTTLQKISDIIMVSNEAKGTFPDCEDFFLPLTHIEPSQVRIVFIGTEPVTALVEDGFRWASLSALENFFKQAEVDNGVKARSLTLLTINNGALFLNMAWTGHCDSLGAHLKLYKSLTDSIVDYLLTTTQCVFVLLGPKVRTTLAPIFKKHRRQPLCFGHPDPGKECETKFISVNPFRQIVDKFGIYI